MTKTQRGPSSSKFVVTPAAGDKPATVRNKETGEVRVLRGYGSMKGELALRKGVDLTKPIYEQVLKLDARPKRKSSRKRVCVRSDGPGPGGRDKSGCVARQGIEALKVELTPDAAQWVQAALASGRFPTAEDAVRYAINRAKRAELREMLEASEAEGGSYSTEDARRHVREHLDRLKQTSSAS